MTATPRDLANRLFDTMKQKHQLATDAALARFLSERSGTKVPHITLSRWRKGELPPAFCVLASELIAHSDSIRTT